MNDEVLVRRLGRADLAVVMDAAVLFDNQPDRRSTERFLNSVDHHLLMAFIGSRAVGFVSGVELTHPDKGVEMFLYELGVDPSSRNRGIGTALAKALATLARERGCRGMWVLTGEANAAARAAYRRAGATVEDAELLMEWRFD